jgi:hypothetical protein
MKTIYLLRFALIAATLSNLGCNLAGRLIASHNRALATNNAVRTSNSTRTSNASASKSAGSIGIIDKEYAAYGEHVREKFSQKNFVWVDQEAHKDRVSKERLPGGYWKLRALYNALEKPALEDKASDGDWEDLLNSLASWSKQQPTSLTAKVALAAAWQRYAWKARGDGYGDTVSDTAWEVFRKRLASARQALSEASALDERCPYWYETALWVGIGQNWGREGLDKIFDAGVELEPTFYYLYQTKATYLLPRWGGTEGEWEKFAHDSALKLGGDQGDIVFFAIYSEMLTLHGMDLMNSHQQDVPKLLAGFHSIEKLYGASAHRMNEAAFFGSMSNEVQTTTQLFNRIGDNFDESVWHSKQTYEVFRQGNQLRAKSAAAQPQTVTRPVAQTAPRTN